MSEEHSFAVPPFTRVSPADQSRDALEVWYEYMDYREAVVDFFREGHYEEISDPNDARDKIDEMFYVNRRKYIGLRLDNQLDNS
ncbi:MAG: hypothetical protein AAGD25_18610 [Cyanobacteria bacterium P01_F01_bin.150]